MSFCVISNLVKRNAFSFRYIIYNLCQNTFRSFAESNKCSSLSEIYEINKDGANEIVVSYKLPN